MPKQMIEVDVPSGWEAVAWRKPEEREHWLSTNGETIYHCGDGTEFQSCWTREPRIIVRPVWQWPTWLKAPWIAMDEDGLWCGFENEPEMWGDEWVEDYAPGEACPLSATLAPVFFDFSPPPCDDWKQSKRRNPNLD